MESFQVIDVSSNDINGEVAKLKIAAETTGCFIVTGTRFAQNYQNLLSVQQ